MPRRNVYEFLITAQDQASGKFGNVESSIGGVNDAVTKLAGITAGLFGVREIAQYADTWRLLQNRMRLVTKDTAELAAVTKELVDVSIETRSSFESTANLYARVARSSRELGISQKELLEFTETVQQSIRISGSTTAEASAGVIQFGQALASSRLSGDELRSVLEQMPRLAQAIAEGFKKADGSIGVGIGTLRELGEAGELSASAVLDALRRTAPGIAKEFKQIDKLVSEAFVVLRSSIQVAVGTIDQAEQISHNLAIALIDVAEQIRLVGDAVAGNLTAESLAELGEGGVKASIGLLVFANTLRILARSLATTGGFIIKSTTELFAAILDTKSIYKPDEIMAAFEIIKKDGAAAFGELNDDIVLDTVDMIERIMQLMGEADLAGAFSGSLSGKSKPLDDIGRKAREEMARNLKTLLKLRDTTLLVNSAYAQSAATGEEYNDALQRVKVNALAAAAGNEALGLEVLQLLEVMQRLRAQRSDKDVVDTLQEELKMINMVNRERFIYVELQKLSAQATKEQMSAVTQAAGELFDRQEELKNQTEFMQNLAERAAQNILDAFADFLFDPFDKGIKGMLEGFLTALRKMLAQALAFQVLSGIPGIKELLPTRAAGGPAFGPTIVGDRGPELVNLPRGSRVINNSAAKAMGGGGGTPTFITHIDARGADPGLIARLPQILEQRDRRLMVAMERYSRTGIMPI